MWLFDLLFSSIPQIWYVEIRIYRNVSESPLEFEITRVVCILVHVSPEEILDHMQKMNAQTSMYIT